MYQIQKSEHGYEFTTESDVKYLIYFTLLDPVNYPFLSNINF